MDEAEDLDNLSDTARKDLIRRLQAERERRREYTERLQEKLKALNNELAARKEEADRSRKELYEEQRNNKEKAEQRRSAGDDGADSGDQLALMGDRRIEEQERQIEKVTHFVEERLLEKVGKSIRRNDLGIRTFDETDLMINKKKEEQDMEAKSIDTVLITYLKPNSDLQYNLSYRVDKETLSKKLREDACVYWGVSEVEFILKTLENSKVHDNLTIQKCFRSNEKAHLLLDQKTPKKTAPEKEELDAIWPKTGKNAKKKKNQKKEEANADPTRGQGVLGVEDFYQSMSELPGLWKFMTQRDRNTVKHLERIRLRDTAVFVTLLVTCIMSFLIMRPPNVEYYCRHGALSAMTEGWYDASRGVQVPAYQDIRSIDHAWEWLTYTVSEQLFVNTSDMRSASYVPGYVQIRMQQIEEPSRAACSDTENMMVYIPAHVVCQHEKVYPKTSGKENLPEVELYWEGCNRSNYTREACQNTSILLPIEDYLGVKGLSGRATSVRPWEFVPAETAALTRNDGTEAGTYQRYDGSGYSLMYNLQSENLTETYAAYVQDMEVLRSLKWISHRTRSVHVDFTSYNGNYDYWVSNWFLIELPPTGIVVPVLDIELYRPISFFSVRDQQLVTLDLIRCGLMVYILTYHLWWEISYERAHQRTAFHYLLRPLGLADVAIAGAIIYIVIIRHLVYGYLGFNGADYAKELSSQFASVKQMSYHYHQHTIAESVLIAAVTFRIMSLWRINRHVFIIWTTIHHAFTTFLRFLLVCLPIMLGFVAVAHMIWGPYLIEHSSYTSSFTSVLMDLYGIKREPISINRPYVFVYSIAFYIVGVIVLLNSWIAVLVSSYQKVRVESGYRPSEYNWTEYQYVSWGLWSPFKTLYLTYLRPKIEKPKDPNTEED